MEEEHITEEELGMAMRGEFKDVKTKKHKVVLVSFGFKYGFPRCNYLFDVTFIRNPVYKKEWEHEGTNTPEMEDFITKQDRFNDAVDMIIGSAQMAAKYTPVRIGIGCSGGRHRSRAVTDYCAVVLKHEGYDVTVEHLEKNDWVM